MKIKILATALVIGGLLSGCGAPKLDSSSEDAYKASLESVSADLSTDDQARLEKALGKLAFKHIMPSALGGAGSIEGFREAVNGKTAEEVFEMAGK